MFTQPVSSPPAGPQTQSPVSPSRHSRLRGLSYLRNYTQNHLLSRDHNSGSSGASSPGRTGSNSLTRSVSYEPTSTSNSAGGRPARNTNRLTLVTSTPSRSQGRLPKSSSSSSSASGDSSEQIAEPSTSNQSNTAADQPTTTTAAEGADEQANMTRARASSAERRSGSPESAPSIRFSAYYDPRSTRPSLTFSPVSRTLANGGEAIRVGRYSERDNQAMAAQGGAQAAVAPVGFKSKVVSRRHCEFWCEDGKWFIKDVKSSSGTFLNHIRLSPPSQESKAFPINDGDIVQLGIDFKGGEEMIFRCVKMRVELNRGWQNKLNTFNMAAHKRLRNMADKSESATGSSSQDCSICLNSIAPCQSLFVAPCSHTWHFKCVRALLTSPSYPVFICPNCRAGADLEADVDEPAEEWEQLEEEEAAAAAEAEEEGHAADQTRIEEPAEEDSNVHDGDAMDVTVSITPDSPAERSNATSEPVPIRNSASAARLSQSRDNRTPSPPNGAEGPITPSNDAGPWVFDGSAVGRGAGSNSGMGSLDAAAMDVSGQSTSDHSEQ